MATDSPSHAPLPPARPRRRRSRAAASFTLEPASRASALEEPLADSLIGEGPRAYLVGREDWRSFDEMKAAFDAELRPTDPVESLWVDEFVDLVWELHRLRNTRRAILETALTDRLASMAAMGRTRLGGGPPDRSTREDLRYAAQGYIRGVPEAVAAIEEAIGYLNVGDELQAVQIEALEMLLRLDSAIQGHLAPQGRDPVEALRAP